MSAVAEEVEKNACFIQAPLEGAIGPASFDLIKRVHKKALKTNCSSIKLDINTPGGSLGETRKIVSLILKSKIPFLCLVGPNGGQAGSAGAIILQACHFTGAMPNTTIGAATPILNFGQNIGTDLKSKVLNDTITWVEGLAIKNGRNKEIARQFVSEAKVVSGDEAFSLGVVEAYVESHLEFLQVAGGKTVLVSGNEKQSLRVGSKIEVKKDFRFFVLDLLTDPQWAYLLFLASMGLIYFEITHPGTFIPGIVGAMGLIASLISFQKLDAELAGVALLVLGFILFSLEVFISSFGMLGFGGVVALFLGSVFLFDPLTTGYSLPLPLIFGVVFSLSCILFGIVFLYWSSQRLIKNKKEMIGEKAIIKKRLTALRYQVEIKGELWRYESDLEYQEGDEVEIKSISGLTLK